MRRELILGMACAGLSWASLAPPATAQRIATAKALGDPYYLYAAKTYGDHAADHVHILRQFFSSGSPPSTEWVRQHVDAVRGNADATQQAYAQLSAAIKNDPLEGEQLEEIGQQYSRVLEICDRLDQACTEATVDTAIMSQVFDQLQSSLSGAGRTPGTGQRVGRPALTRAGGRDCPLRPSGRRRRRFAGARKRVPVASPGDRPTAGVVPPVQAYENDGKRHGSSSAPAQDWRTALAAGLAEEYNAGGSLRNGRLLKSLALIAT